MKWRWYHGVLFYVGVEALAFGLAQVARKARRTGGGADAVSGTAEPQKAERATETDAPQESKQENEYEAFYNSLRQPVFAPPAPVFGPAWFVNNALTIWGLLRVLNLPPETPGRRAYLASQTVFWLSYGTFSAAYFGLRSPVAGAVLTDIGLAAALAGEYTALVALKDKKAALALSTLVPWLLLAAPTAMTVAAWNRDEFLGIGPFAEPPPGWEKRRSEASELQVEETGGGDGVPAGEQLAPEGAGRA